LRIKKGQTKTSTGKKQQKQQIVNPFGTNSIHMCGLQLLAGKLLQLIS
jgi:hypothetical protein